MYLVHDFDDANSYFIRNTAILYEKILVFDVLA